MLDGELVRRDSDGTTYWSAPENRVRARQSGAYLLPTYDEYLIAYKDRRAAFDRTRWRHTASGDPFSAPIVLNGFVVGAWRRRFTANRVIVTTTLHAPLTRADASAIDDAARAYAEFIGMELQLAHVRL